MTILTDQNAENWTRYKAGELLANLSREDLISDLEDAYRKNWDDDVRRFVVEALVRTRSEMAIPALERTMQSHERFIQDLSREGINYIRNREFLEDATLVRVSSATGEKEIRPGYDLSPSEAVNEAIDGISRYRFDAFLKLREECPEGSGHKLVDVALNPGENEFFRSEAVKLIGSMSEGFADFLLRVFTAFSLDDPAQGSSARGYAIEHLAYRKHYEALRCIVRCQDLASRTANERTKVFWALNQLVVDIDVDELNEYRKEVEAICEKFKEEPYARLHHWRRRAIDQLQARLTRAPEPAVVSRS